MHMCMCVLLGEGGEGGVQPRLDEFAHIRIGEDLRVPDHSEAVAHDGGALRNLEAAQGCVLCCHPDGSQMTVHGGMLPHCFLQGPTHRFSWKVRPVENSKHTSWICAINVFIL